MRRPIIAGNWKLFKTRSQTREFFEAFLPKIDGLEHCDIVVAPPFTALDTAAAAAAGSGVGIAAQDVYWEPEGAFTGEVSAPMLAEVGCTYVIVGHSERRQYFGETDLTVSRKIGAVISGGMKPIVCVGETLEERESGEAEATVRRQLTGGLGPLTPPDLSPIIVAYEPVWAIGTGRTATPEIAQGMHAAIRSAVGEMYGSAPAEALPILYGGSVKPDNIAELMAAPDIDGALVGGASLKPDSFAAIVRYPENR
jgi:triosephosphate isomerase